MIAAGTFEGVPLPTQACTSRLCQAVPDGGQRPGWWTLDAVALRCPHGFVGLHCAFAGACMETSCCETAVATQRAAESAHPSLPARADPIRFPREVRLPLGNVDGVVLPFLLAMVFQRVECFAFHENSLAFTWAWHGAGFSAASLADRPSSRPPPPGAHHFIAEDRPFFNW